MKSKAVTLGHPIHPMLIPFPFAFLTGAVLFDAAWWFHNIPSWWTTGGYLSLVGIATALLPATKHMLANLTVVALFSCAWWIRGGPATRPDAIGLGLEERIVLARTEKGYVAFDDRCTHTGGSLAGGVMMCAAPSSPTPGSRTQGQRLALLASNK